MSANGALAETCAAEKITTLNAATNAAKIFLVMSQNLRAGRLSLFAFCESCRQNFLSNFVLVEKARAQNVFILVEYRDFDLVRRARLVREYPSRRADGFVVFVTDDDSHDRVCVTQSAAAAVSGDVKVNAVLTESEDVRRARRTCDRDEQRKDNSRKKLFHVETSLNVSANVPIEL